MHVNREQELYRFIFKEARNQLLHLLLLQRNFNVSIFMYSDSDSEFSNTFFRIPMSSFYNQTNKLLKFMYLTPTGKKLICQHDESTRQYFHFAFVHH